VTNYTGLWKLLYDWQTIITGPLAILAAVIGGGMAYWAGWVQAKATRRAADLQVAAINAQLAHLKAEKEEAEERANVDRKKREITQINVAITGMGTILRLCSTPQFNTSCRIITKAIWSIPL
jgi:NAD(P)H-dependent flavin oxidoreductase YrpB (nitropropane dioxygenase family)